MTARLKSNDIVSGLRRLGIGAGMKLIVHSSMKSFGRLVDGGPETVIRALMEALTDRGTLMMPSFNHYVPFEPQGPGYYDPRNTPTTNGIIPDTFWRMAHVYRSLNPSHAFAAWGKDAEAYVRYHHRTLTFGVNSPLEKLYADGGHCLFIGVRGGANSFQHVVETLSGADCLGKRTEQYSLKLPDGRRVLGRTWSWRRESCPCQDQWVDELSGQEQRTPVAASTLRLYSLQQGFPIIAKYMRCQGCCVRPRENEWTIPTDWDDAASRLQSDSLAHTY